MMGETFKYCALVAGTLGFSAENTVEAIGLCRIGQRKRLKYPLYSFGNSMFKLRSNLYNIDTIKKQRTTVIEKRKGI